MELSSMTKWIYRIMIFVPAGRVELINALWTLLGPEGNSEMYTFGVPMSAEGVEPVSYRGCNTAATEEMYQMMIEFLEIQGAGPDVVRYVMDAHIEMLLEVVNSEAEIGQPWTWPEALADAGLQLMQEEAI